MKKGALNIIELHVDKLILGLAVVFMIFTVVHYLMGPNRVEYKGQTVGPGELDEAIYAEAQRMQQAYNSARSETAPVPDFAAQLREETRKGLFADGTVPRDLPVAVQFNPPLPTFEEEGEGGKENIVLVTPLAPTSPALRTGLSLVDPQPALRIGGGPIVPVVDTGAERESQAMPWVTVGMYYPAEAQRREMVNAGYAGYMSKVYVVGVDVQRQEMTASGEWTDWADVDPGPAMPKVVIPALAMDDRTGQILNQNELDATLDQIKAYERQIEQPPFLPVDAGDEWMPPPLAGHEDKPEVEEEKEPVERPQVERQAPRERAAPTPPPSRFGGGGGRGGRAARGGGGGGRAPAGGGGAAAPTPRPTGGGPEVEGRKDVRALFQKLREAFAAKDYSGAIQTAQEIERHASATRGQRNKATKYITRIERLQKRTESTGATAEAAEFIRQPETNEPAVWFNDTSVEPGKTYRYRMRVKLWNRYVGRINALKNPDQARQIVLVGDWSLPTDGITVAPKQHFFVAGQRFGEPPAARVDVFSWYDGDWLKETFEVQVGDAVGSRMETRVPEWDKELRPVRKEVDFATDAVVLDLRFDEPLLQRRVTGKDGSFAYDDRDALVLVYLDPADGQIKQRVDAVDRNDPLYRRLKKEYSELMD